MINNRQNGRRRGRGGQRSQGGGSQGSRDNGNRIDSRARGNASQLYEKYKNMAADAQRQGDRVNTEYYLQFADHYFRVLADQRGRYEDQGQQRRPHNDFGNDEDYGDEGEPIRAEDQGRAGDERGDREDRQQDGNRARTDRDYDRDASPRSNGQDGRSQDSRSQDGRSRDGQERRPRHSAPRQDQRRDDRPAEEPNDAPVTAEMAGAQAVAPQDDVSAPAESTSVAKRRGRPRKVQPDAGEQLGLDAGVLPPSIGGDQTVTEAAPKPRRRRTVAAPAEVDA